MMSIFASEKVGTVCSSYIGQNLRLSECFSRTVSVELVVSVCASANINFSPESVICDKLN